jgi:hypothetical protein
MHASKHVILQKGPSKSSHTCTNKRNTLRAKKAQQPEKDHPFEHASPSEIKPFAGCLIMQQNHSITHSICHTFFSPPLPTSAICLDGVVSTEFYDKIYVILKNIILVDHIISRS